MANVNTCTISGNVTRDPETRWIADDGGSAIVSFGVAVNRRRFDKATDDYIESVSFFDIEVFGGFAVVVAKKLRKADAVTIQGRLEQQTWGEEDAKRSKIVIVCDQIDSDAFFRPKDEDATVSVGQRTAIAQAAAPKVDAAPAATPAADDDIPF
ncbi:MAG: single-stranded DNA-binding protein [Actinobacteria bacterium]|nr:single-stranded DNA-binding protein [Actinomycetota bacterium]